MVEKLLTRTQFREITLARNGGLCAVPACGLQAVDAHHILNRRLFGAGEEGGYYLSNGAQLCSDHHYQAEATRITVEELREYCGIAEPALPNDFSNELTYDCWGNVIREDGTREPGPLFHDEGFQKLARKERLLWLFY